MTVELGARPTTPRSCDHDNRLRRYRDAQDRGEIGTGGTTATILVVDDEPDLEKLVTRKFRRQIREQLISFVFARDGLEALQSIEQHPHVDLVVLDINMPRMDGLSLLAKLQEREDKKSAIIVSAYGDMRNIRTG
jgi:CheY-like chemotaxis protein